MQIEILVGSTLGGTEYVAESAQTHLEEAGITSTLHFTPDLKDLSFSSNSLWLICLSTHGAGDYPENFKQLVTQIEAENIDLKSVQFGLIGVGDSNYDTFCHAAVHFDHLLEAKGATRLGELFKIDVVDSPIPEDTLVDWIPLWIKDLNNLTN